VTSSRKRAANRRNAELSTGPKTASGKAVASKNALRHGLLSRQVVLPDEDPAEFEDFRRRLMDDLKPTGELETVFAERIMLGAWRLRRVVRLEAAVIRSQESELQAFPDLATLMAAASRVPDTPNAAAQASPQLDEQARSELNVYNAMVRDANGTNQLERLRRYETTIEKSLLSSIHELERLQKRRLGEAVVAPRVIDVNLLANET
jgi:hypothetical protein